MARFLSLCPVAMLATATGACSTVEPKPGAQEPAPEPRTQQIRLDGLGLGFELPLAWSGQTEGQARVYSGPEGTAGYFTTITVQALDSAGTPLGEILETAYAELAKKPGFAWKGRQPDALGQRQLLRYELEFELHEVKRRKAGLLIAAAESGTRVVDIAYAAPASLFEQGRQVFADLENTLAVSGRAWQHTQLSTTP